MIIKDAEYVFHFPLETIEDEQGEICVGVQSREHDMNIAQILKIGFDNKILLIETFRRLHNYLEIEVENKNADTKIQNYDGSS